jgi:hypothetical protein
MLNMYLYLQSLLGSCVQLYSLTETLQLPSPSPACGLIYEGATVNQDRRHPLVTPCERDILNISIKEELHGQTSDIFDANLSTFYYIVFPLPGSSERNTVISGNDRVGNFRTTLTKSQWRPLLLWFLLVDKKRFFGKGHGKARLNKRNRLTDWLRPLQKEQITIIFHL